MKHLKKIVTTIGILCLTNTFFAQAGLSDNTADDFFEFVIVDDEVVSDTPQVDNDEAEEDSETGTSSVVPMVSGRAVTAESASVEEPSAES